MPSVTLVPVDHEPDFGGVSFVPVDHNPFSANGMIEQARGQLASQPERFPTSYGNPEGDQAAMSPETYANPYVKGLIDSVATLPRRAIENSQQSLDTGNYDPGPTLEAATLPMGTGAIAGVPVRAGEAVLGAGLLRVARNEANGAVRIGKPGQIHADLMNRKELAAATDAPDVAASMGYASPDGRFLTRDEALQFALQNEPQRAAWSAQQPQFGLDAATYHNEPR
jgi:hypothetical protein